MEQAGRGHLKIFFSYAQNIGKTYAMLKTAQSEKEKGVDVVVGYMAPHTCLESLALMEGMEKLPLFIDEGSGEFDLDGALKRNPSLILVDELAHSNSKNCRHRKRWQDINELLKAGIDVYTTVNVSNIESLHDTVSSITGIASWNRIPDSNFDNADQVELIDMEPEELIRRLSEKNTAGDWISMDRLAALREIALRRCADRIKYLSDRVHSNKNYHTEEHVLACISSAPSNGKIIRTAARMANAFHSKFTALFVETPDFVHSCVEDKKRLQQNQQLARELGANIEIVYGEDVSYQISEFARLSGVTKIVLGQSAVTRRNLLGKPTLTEQLISHMPEIDIHIIPDQNVEMSYRHEELKSYINRNTVSNTAKTAGILSAATLLSLLFDKLGFTDANIIMVYILGVLITSVATSHLVYSLVSSIASVFIFNYLFTMPRFSLAAYGTGYPVTFVVMFMTAFITGTFAIRYKEQAGQSAKISYRTKILFDTDQMLSKAKDKDEILTAAAKQIVKLLGRNIVIFGMEDGKLSEPVFFPANEHSDQFYDREKEFPTVDWVLKNNHSAGATTDTLSDADFYYLALRVDDRVYGVVGIAAKKDPLDASEHSILLSLLGECALALENEKNAREKEAAAILAENERLRANLLRTISHDLRTPLTSISGNADNLFMNESNFDLETRKKIYKDIYDDSMWLNNLVENLLSATRIEEGRLMLRTSTELISDMIEEALRHIDRMAAKHHISVRYENELILVKADIKLIVQVIINIVDNAIKYTPEDSDILITTRKNGAMVQVSIADNGPGLTDEEKTKIFDKFYCGENTIADNRRSLGLGLFLCKSIVEAHGGIISVTDNEPHGTVFHFLLPREEVILHE